ncbi:MAG TPA: hypothetical protein DEP72_03155 [Clostridiales bacterium]|nr:hypothetical protein [Clostridiales bacterium]
MDNYQGWIRETDAGMLKSVLEEMLLISKFAVLGFDEVFQPDRYMGAWILGESHLAIHVFPNDNKTYVELTSCIKEKSDEFRKIFELMFGAISIDQEEESRETDEKTLGSYDSWIKVTDPDVLKNDLGLILEESKFSTSKVIGYMFQPEGYTGVWMLKEGHLAIHTFPEGDKTYVQLTSESEEQVIEFREMMEANFEQTYEDPQYDIKHVIETNYAYQI